MKKYTVVVRLVLEVEVHVEEVSQAAASKSALKIVDEMQLEPYSAYDRSISTEFKTFEVIEIRRPAQ